MKICRICGTKNKTEFAKKGNSFIEFVLWFCYIFPGLIYSIWRRSNRKTICSICGSDQLIPVNSFMGKKIQKEMRE